MARRREPGEGSEAPVMPPELLERRNLPVRREWYALFGPDTWPEQHAALVRARLAHGLTADGRQPDEPDPRDVLAGLPNDSTAFPRTRRKPRQ